MTQRPAPRRPPPRAGARPRLTGGASVVSPGQPAVGVQGAAVRRRPRITGRMAVLVLVVAVLTISYASSMRAYLQQRAHIVDLKSQIVDQEGAIDDLSREKDRWSDPAFVQQQARERFGYVMPGETAYVVLDENGDPLEPEATLSDDAPPDVEAAATWWDRGWASVEVAGNPPPPEESPLTRVDGSRR